MYEKQTWKNGDVITEDKLNHIEDGIATGGGIYTYGEVALFDGEVTTVNGEGVTFAGAEISLQDELPKSDIHITFNGQNYTLPYGQAEWGDYWGELADNAPSFTNYPVFVYGGDVYGDGIYTPEEGTYSLKINETVEKIEVSDAFQNDFYVSVNSSLNGLTLDKTYSEIYEACAKHKNVRFIQGDSFDNVYTEYHVSYVTGSSILLFTVVVINGSNTIQTYNFKYTVNGYPSTTNGGLS